MNKIVKKENRFSIISILIITYTVGLLALNIWYVFLQMRVNDYLASNGLTQENPTGSWVVTSLSEADTIYELEILMSDLRQYIFYFCILFLAGSLLLFLKKYSFAFSLYVFFSTSTLGSLLYYGAIGLGFVYPSNFNFQFSFLEVYALPFLIALLGIHTFKWIYFKSKTAIG